MHLDRDDIHGAYMIHQLTTTPEAVALIMSTPTSGVGSRSRLGSSTINGELADGVMYPRLARNRNRPVASMSASSSYTYLHLIIHIGRSVLTTKLSKNKLLRRFLLSVQQYKLGRPYSQEACLGGLLPYPENWPKGSYSTHRSRLHQSQHRGVGTANPIPLPNPPDKFKIVILRHVAS